MKQLMKVGAATFLVMGMGAGMASAQEPMAKSERAISTPEFVTMAARSDEFEIKEGKLAEMAGTAPLRKFGAMMVRDHTKTTEAMHKALKEAGMAVPPPPALTAEQDGMLAKLKGLSGEGFDHAYLEQAAASHKKALALHEAYDKTGDVAPIVAASKEATPIVRDHLRVAERMASGKSGEM